VEKALVARRGQLVGAELRPLGFGFLQADQVRLLAGQEIGQTFLSGRVDAVGVQGDDFQCHGWAIGGWARSEKCGQSGRAVAAARRSTAARNRRL
jgi:hypothetical protein